MDEKEREELNYYYNRGDTFFDLGKFEDAIQNYDKAIELDSNVNSACYYNRGTAYFSLGKFEDAIQDYNKAIDLNPNDDLSYNNKGNAYFSLGKFEDAIQDYNKAIDLNPNNASYYYNRGTTFANLEKFEDAIQDYNKAIDLNPNDESVYYNRGVAFIYLNEYEKAIENLSKAIDLDPNFSDAYNIRGVSYVNQKKFSEAIKDFSKAIDLNPNDKEYYYNLGNLYSNLNEYEKAIENLSKAIDLDPNFSDACDVIGIISTIQNNEKVIKFGKNSFKQNIKEFKEPIYSIIFNQINSLYITGNLKKIKDELLPKIQDFKKESKKQKNNSEIDKLTKRVELVESIFKDEPQKLEGYLIFADILGWKGIWKKQDKKNIASVTFGIKSILEKEFDRELKEKKYNVSLISDTFIVFSKEWELSNKVSKKLIELCLENDLVIRGAISYGECYNKDTVYVGQAIDEAASWHDEGEEIGIFCTPSAKQEIINNDYDLPEDFIKLKSGEINTFFINWYNKETKKKFDELFSKIDKSSIKVYLKYLNTEKKFNKYLKEEKE